MKRIDTATKHVDKFGAGKHGWRDGDKANAIVATQFSAAMMDNIQEEIANVIEAAGIALDGNDMTQLKQAIAQMIINGGAIKTAVRAASTVPINLAAPGANIDGVAMVVGDRFLEKDNVAGELRGIYVWNGAAVAATRALDANGASEIVAGMLVVVQEGTTNADTIWELATDGPIAVGVSSQTYILAGSNKFVKKAGDTLQGALALFGGDTGVTPAQFDVTTKLATMEALQRALGNYRGGSTAINGNTTLVTADISGKFVQISGAGPYTVTLPLVAGVQGGTGFGLITTGSGTFTIQRQGADTIYQGLNSPVTSFTMQSGDSVYIMADGGAWNIVWGSKLLALMPQFAASLSTNGYQKLPSGLIIQVASVTANNVGTAFLWPITFPNLLIGAAGINKNASHALWLDGAGLSGATLKTESATTTANFIISIGY